MLATALALVTLTGAVVVASPPPPAVAWTVTPDVEAQLVGLVNRERIDAGLPPLRRELQLTRIAREWAATMAATGGISHREDLAAQLHGDWTRAGENVGRGSDLGRIHDAFMASPTHRANVLGTWDALGVGVVEGPGGMYLTVNFLAGRGDFPVFRDVARNAHRPAIESLFARATTGGCTGDRYCPTRSISRGQLATFVARELRLPATAPRFDDVPGRHPHAGAIGALVDDGIIFGCTPTRFCPDEPVTRAQLATFLTRALGVSDASHGFRDVPAGHRHGGAIGALVRAGITGGCDTGRYCPDGHVTRAQMASFLARAFPG